MPPATTPPATRAAQGTPRFDALLKDLRASPLEEWPAHLRDVSLLDVAHALTFDRERYTRTLLAADAHAEVFLLGWLPGQASAVHDHGSSQGAALVLAGEAQEETFEVVDGRARLASKATLRRGSATLERRDGVHRVQNAGTNLLVTLHAYAPRLTEYATYDVEG